MTGCQFDAIQQNSHNIIENPFNKNLVSKEDAAYQGFQIIGKNQNGKTHSSLINNQWELGEVNIKSWPLNYLFCKQCNFSLDRRHHPDGPTVWLKVNNGSKNALYVISSYQARFQTSRWKFSHEGEMVIISDQESDFNSLASIGMPVKKTLNLDDRCSLLWGYKYKLEQPPLGISNDVAKFRSQFIIQCET